MSWYKSHTFALSFYYQLYPFKSFFFPSTSPFLHTLHRTHLSKNIFRNPHCVNLMKPLQNKEGNEWYYHHRQIRRGRSSLGVVGNWDCDICSLIHRTIGNWFVGKAWGGWFWQRRKRKQWFAFDVTSTVMPLIQSNWLESMKSWKVTAWLLVH